MGYRNNVSNSDNIIDSRDIIKRIRELEDELEDDNEDNENIHDELNALKELESEAEGYCEWRNGAALIRDSYFHRYAEELAKDIGAIDANAKWPLNHIDWEAAADELKDDYTSVEFDGVDYWVR